MDTTNVVDSGEVWKDIPTYEGRFQASNLGRIRSLGFALGNQYAANTYFKSGVVRKPTTNRNGYLLVSISKEAKNKTFTIHSLICLTFIGPRPEGYTINHIDGVKSNNQLNNLEYVTLSQNIRHGIEIGLITSNKRDRKCKLTDEQVRTVRQHPRALHTQKRFAEQYSVHVDTIKNIWKGKAYKWVK